MPRSRKAQKVSTVSSLRATRQNTASTSNPTSTKSLVNPQTPKKSIDQHNVKKRKRSACRPSTSTHHVPDLSDEEELCDPTEVRSTTVQKSSRVLRNCCQLFP
ncbi:hypothetical protein GCK72_020358 [Caenorhabditis remanei]|uniref:Uncharacterized protein n=1 Tax=Caenorhabditis remanei TaxID=31234 RepID=A0A6A5GGS9_CAERE|nr:hypothetical protein GCK72_020358 [Caenorhabditis remanei]KAF1753801.1 hypothetical protein GCK72_020358 [Caenorhabditis remanei]